MTDSGRMINREFKVGIIIAVCGPICSGKTTWCMDNMEETDSYIKVSNIVKSISNAKTREELQNTKELSQQIASTLVEILSEKVKTSENVYVDGIRQLDILLEISTKLPAVYLHLLKTPIEVRQSRYNSRADTRDKGISFEEADQKDYALGLADIEQFYKTERKAHPITFGVGG
jgi:predicted kinase